MSTIRINASLALVASLVAMAMMALPVSSAAASTTSTSLGRLLVAGDHSRTLTWGGHQRNYIVHVPTGKPVANRPLILVYHGANDTAAHTIALTDFEQVANRVGDIVVFMQGYQDTWNELAGNTPAAQAHIDDVGFTGAVLNALKPLTAYDTTRVALTGLSNGALMVETLGCRLAGRIRLIVPVEGQLDSNVSPSCAPSRPIDVYEIHGTADPTIPYDGGDFNGVGGVVSVLSAPASAARWADLDGCSHPTISTSSGISLTRYTPCRAGVTVTLRTIKGGVHVWGANIGELVTAALGR